MQSKLTLSPLGHTWIFDLDGTLCVHNGYLLGGDRILPGVKDLFGQIPAGDMIVILTSRKEEERGRIEQFMRDGGLRFDILLCNAPMGERVIVNDDKPSGLKTCFAVNKKRDEAMNMQLQIDPKL